MELNYAVFIGRFQPFHLGHHAILARALANYHRVMVVIGSAQVTKKSVDMRNPWTAKERRAMIQSSFPPSEKLFFLEVKDDQSDRVWADNIEYGAAIMQAGLGKANVSLVGCQKPNDPQFLDLFPDWSRDLTDFNSDMASGSAIRRMFFDGTPESIYSNHVPPATRMFLRSYDERYNSPRSRMFSAKRFAL